MPKEPLISVIISVYNIEQYISKCIESVIKQREQNLEIILVDDGSTDASSIIVDKYAKKDNRIKVIHKINGGLSSARNAGLNVASGKYIFFVDGDDFIATNAIEVLAKTMKNHDYDIICFNHYVSYEDKDVKMYSKQRYWDVPDDVKYVISSPSACNRVYKRDFLIKNKLYFREGIIYEDLALIPSLVIFTSKICLIEDFLYYYVIRVNSIMHETKFKKNRDDKFIALETLTEYFTQNGLFDKYKNEIEYLYIRHLLIMYSLEILKYNKEIYMPRIHKAVDLMNNKFPNWTKNIYLKKEPIHTRIYLFTLKYKIIWMTNLISKIATKFLG